MVSFRIFFVNLKFSILVLYITNPSLSIIKSYGEDITLPWGHDKKGYFQHIPSKGLSEKLLEEYYKPGFKMLDIGCGMGNVLRVAEHIGYDTTGIEINENLKKYHEGLNVIYGDVLYLDDYSFLKDFDIIYLYRPIAPLDKCDDLFQKIYDSCKDSCIIIYLLPSQLELNLKRKFEYKMFPDTDSPKIKMLYTEYKWDKEFEEYYSIMKPKRGVKDMDIQNVINKCFDILKEYGGKNGK